jgi:hypothetical protein
MWLLNGAVFPSIISENVSQAALKKTPVEMTLNAGHAGSAT